MHLFLWEGMEVRDSVPKLLSCWKAITGGKVIRQKVSLKQDSYLKYSGYAITVHWYRIEKGLCTTGKEHRSSQKEVT